MCWQKIASGAERPVLGVGPAGLEVKALLHARINILFLESCLSKCSSKELCRVRLQVKPARCVIQGFEGSRIWTPCQALSRG